MPFRYLRDPLFIFCVVLYFINRLILKPLITIGDFATFCYSYLNDLICIPLWVTIIVWILYTMGVRKSEEYPQGAEILLPVVVWAWFFELFLPRTASFRNLAVSDPKDIVCYVAGALFAVIFWSIYYRKRRSVVTR